MKSVCVEFELDRYTKNTGKFQEVAALDVDDAAGPALAPAVNTIYIQKWVLAHMGNPTTIFVEIRANKETV